ncbi:MAG: SLBB domain-containing protein [Lachnospiraceae bacterium]|nr:SLBB domain-containing protein [Lachnospiraceae bacterium]
MAKTVSFISRRFGKYDPWSLSEYEAHGGFQGLRRALTMDGYEITKVLSANGIQGRGGAAYDMGRKWTQAKDVQAPDKCVVCNADEGEPGTFKDREMLRRDPFQVLEGMIIAGWSVDAKNGYLYLREEYSHLQPLLRNAIRQCEEAGYLGDNILGSGLNYRIHLYSGAGAYVCGEGSALAESIEGKSGRPRMKPPYIKQCGVFHLPTCVNNVDSLSLVPNVLMDEEGFYKRQGTPECPGTKMISVSGNVENPGVFEIPFGTTIREIIELAGGVTAGHRVQLVQLGGASGCLASPAQLDTPYTYKDMKKAGLTAIGSGAVLVVDERTSVVGFLRMTQEFFCHESCGQCTPCREGNRHIALLLDKLAAGTHTQKDIDTMLKFAHIMCNASLCGLGESAQSALLSAVEHFPEVFEVKKEVAIR